MTSKLHWNILIGFGCGIAVGLLAVMTGTGQIVDDWISPFGTIFVNLLKLVAVPLVFCSLVSGISSLPSVSRLSSIGGKTLALYVATTVVAICIGLVLVNTFHPGDTIPHEVGARLQAVYESTASSHADVAQSLERSGPLEPLVRLVPDNIFGAFSNNLNMLQVVIISTLFGVALALCGENESNGLRSVISGLNQVILMIVRFAMAVSPLGVFALISATLVSIVGDEPQAALSLLWTLGFYCAVVALGLLIHICAFYGSLVMLLTSIRVPRFFKAIAPAQLVAFTTTSAAATLPVSIECVEDDLGVQGEIAAFVLPIGATVNLDGTALYQTVAAVFIAQVLGIHLSTSDQLVIVGTALLASIGTAPVPGAGLVMLVVVLESVGIPSAGVGLIIGVDRILDMLRTVTNVTGDCTVAAIVDAWEHAGSPVRRE